MSAAVSPAPTHATGAPPVQARRLRPAARELAALTLLGLVVGAVVVGVLARLAMFVLASMNPEAAGVTSDDGFEIGQFTLSGSLQLVASGLQFGVLGTFGYAAARGLMVGPGWFRLASISLGPGVVVGAVLVHTEGVDFTVLEPAWLAAAMFVALPTVFVALLHLGAPRVLAGADRLPRPLVALGLLPWVVAFPLTLLLLAGWWVVGALDGAGTVRPVVAWLLRVGLAVVFVFAIVDLVRDLVALG